MTDAVSDAASFRSPAWRYAPALLFAATPAIAWWGNLYRFYQYDGLSHWDWASLSFSTAISLMLAAFAAILAKKFDRWGALVLSASAVSAAWIAFLVPAQSGGGAALLEIGGALIWLFCGLSLWGYGYARVQKINWVTQPFLALGSFACLWFLAHELVVVFMPMWFG